MQIKNWIYLNSFLCLLILSGCDSNPKKETKMLPETGDWRMEMSLGEGLILPFQFSLKENAGEWEMTIFNAKEEIVVDEITWRDDTMVAQLPVFESEFILKVIDFKSLSGVWINHYKGDDYRIESRASHGKQARFLEKSDAPSINLAGKYAVLFSPESESPGPAIGLFEQEGSNIIGTFATERGDYRHLEGNVFGNTLFLSTFDGSHAFLFKAEQTDSGLVGQFFSGVHWEEDWVAVKNDSVSLRNADSLTFIKEGYEGIDFSFPNEKGKQVSLKDERYQNKAVIVQIMGSWCPNCLDETNYFSELYSQYNEQGLEIIALAFERTKTAEQAIKNLARIKKKTNASYEFLLAGSTRADKAAEKLPMLNHVMSYPTSIFIDKDGKVRRIHTGFYGPSTGNYYIEFTEKTEKLVEEMLSELDS